MEERAVYKLCKNKIFNEDLGWYETYGIYDNKKTVKIDDVTTDLILALKILTILNSNKVSTVHFKDVVMDMLE